MAIEIKEIKDGKGGLFSSTILYSVGNVFSRSMAFLLLPIYSNVLTTTEFGIFSILYSTYSILSFIYPQAFQLGFMQYYIDAKNDLTRKKIYSTTILLTLLVSIVLTVIISVFSKSISILIVNNDSFYRIISLISLLLLVDNVNFFATNYLKTNQRARKVIYFTSIAALSNFILNIFFLFVIQIKIEGIFLSQLIANFINALMLLSQQKERFVFIIEKETVKKIFLFSTPIFISGIFGTLIDVADRFILDHYTDKSTVGIYSFSYRIAMVMNVFVYSFRTAWLPYAKVQYTSGGNFSKTFGYQFSKLIALASLLFISVTLFTRNLFAIKLFGYNFFNSQYQVGEPIIAIILLGYFFNGLYTFYSFYPFIIDKSRYFLIADFIAFVINIILNFILIPKYGMYGAAYATAISFIINALYLYFIAYNKFKIEYQFDKIFYILLSTIVIFIISRLILNLYIDLILFFSFIMILKFMLSVKLSNIFSFIESNLPKKN